MKAYTLSHLADHVLLHDLRESVAQDRATTAVMLAQIAEVDARRLYLPAAYPSMYHYCVGELHLSEGAAFKRIRAARTARQFPAIFAALADGRLHLSAVVLLAPHLTPDTADELLAAAANKTRAELELLLAQRFPRPDVATRVEVIEGQVAGEMLALAPVDAHANQLAPGPVGMTKAEHAPGHAGRPGPRANVEPLSPQRFALQLTIPQDTHDKLRYAQALLGHALPSGDVAQVLDRALDALIHRLEQRKFAAAARSRQGPRRRAAGARTVPADVRRTVWQRDGGQCTFVSERGQRCSARTRLEFAHMDPVARGGRSSVDGVRLRCRAHNQYAAECAFGAGLIDRKRQEARRNAVAARDAAPARKATQVVEEAADKARAQDVIPWLRQLGFRADEARRAAALCTAIPDASLDDRVRHALRSLAPRSALRSGPVASAPS